MNLFSISVSPNGIVANVLDCKTAVREFELTSLYVTHFLTDTFGKSYKLRYFPSFVSSITINVLQGWFEH